MGVFDEEVPWVTLENEPGFVVGDDWASSMKLGDVDCASLGATGSQSHLERYEQE